MINNSETSDQLFGEHHLGSPEYKFFSKNTKIFTGCGYLKKQTHQILP
jgi:hypothetical protein